MVEHNGPSGRWLQGEDGSWVRTPDTPDGLAAAVERAVAALVPAGVMAPYAGSAAPAGWAICDGSAISRRGNPALFDAIGTTYGIGDGTTTFNLPDLRGRVLVGYDATQVEFNALGKTGGEKSHILAATEMPSHNHSATNGAADGGIDHLHYSTITDGAGGHQHQATYLATNNGTGTANSFVRTDGSTGTVGGFAGAAAGGHNHTVNAAASDRSLNHTHANPSIGSTGGGGAHNNLQPFIAVNTIIRIG